MHPYEPTPFDLPEGPGIAADLLLAQSALDGEPAPSPEVAAVRDWLIEPAGGVGFGYAADPDSD